MTDVFQLQYALDTFYFLMCGALVMWMAAGFAMLEAGLVRTKNTTVILTKNIALFGIACTMYMVCGYAIMYGGGDFSGSSLALQATELLASKSQPPMHPLLTSTSR
jgi:Amt family ammonium transporter